MIAKLHDRMLNRERGAGELFTLMLTLPVMLFLLFVIINFSSYYSVRSEVQQAAQQGARLVSLYGGNSSGTALNTSGAPVTTAVKTLVLKTTGKAADGVTCTPPKVTDLGSPVYCTVTYTYSIIAGNDPFGFSKALSNQFSVTASYFSETKYN